MSLTSLLSENSSLRNLIPNFKPQLQTWDRLVMKSTDWRSPILVPSIGRVHEAATIGTSFDYIARQILTAKLGASNVCSDRYVAEGGIGRIPYHLLHQDNFDYEQDQAIKAERIEGLRLAQKHKQDLMAYMEHSLDLSVKSFLDFTAGKINLRQVVPYAIFMARADAVYRSGSIVAIDYFLKDKFGKSYFSQKATISDSDIIDNIVQLAEVFTQHYAKIPMASAALNPNFGEFNSLVGGADADFILDNKELVDIKSTNSLSYSTKDWAQVLGYSAMGIANGINLEKATIYFARFGLSATIDFSSEIKEFLPIYLDKILLVASKDIEI